MSTPLSVVAGWLADDLVESRHLDRDPSVTGLTLSTRRVVPGDLYAAPPGARAHGASFAAQAVEAGAVAVLTDSEGAQLCAGLDVPQLVVERPRRVLGLLAARVYGEPARSMRLVAVTGTQGKTTTTRLAEGALTDAGIAAAVVGTVGTRVTGQDLTTSLTTPEAPDLHALFAVMREHAVQGCVMEVSSHALVMGRVDGVVFDVAAFTNLGRDHLDFHADLEDYFAGQGLAVHPGAGPARAGQRRRRARPATAGRGRHPGAHVLRERCSPPTGVRPASCSTRSGPRSRSTRPRVRRSPPGCR